jgi:hypothetical protein
MPRTEPKQFPQEEFDPELMNETWDLSNDIYKEILEQQRAVEELRATERDEELKKRGVWRKIMDTLVPA